MKVIATCLVAGAAGLMAVSGSQAADLPVKAQPVQYVKICSLYGAGFYYIPGTDTCIKVGGYVRSQAEWGSSNGIPAGTNSFPATGPNTIQNGLFNRASNNFNFTGRAAITVDARSQTEYGTVRGYISLGAQTVGTAEASTFFADRAFIQFAGLTAGRAVSFFDIFTTTERYTYSDPRTSGDTWNYGWFVFAYTAQFGNGFSATISAEAPRRLGVVDGSGGGGPNIGFLANGVTGSDTAGFQMPDIVGNLRIDQNWGYAGISGAVHKVAGGYYGGTASAGFTGTANVRNPDDKYGWAVGVGGMVNLPWIGPGDSIGANFVYSKGAVAYATKGGNWQIFDGNSVGVGWITDGLFDNVGVCGGATPRCGIDLTNAWSVNAAFEHFWNPRWRTSLYGGFTRVWYNQEATNIANQHMPTPPVGALVCGVPVLGAVWPPLPIANGVGNSCTPNFSFYQIGSRTQWNVTSNFYMGVDVTYTHLNTAWQGPSPASPTTFPTSIDDQHVWSGIFRMQHSFVPGNEGPTVIFGR
jgi:hypothetical protein